MNDGDEDIEPPGRHGIELPGKIKSYQGDKLVQSQNAVPDGRRDPIMDVLLEPVEGIPAGTHCMLLCQLAFSKLNIKSW